MQKLLLKGANINGEICDILTEGNVIKKIASNITKQDISQCFELNGDVVVPGLVDCHAHIDKSYINDNGRTFYQHGTGPEKGALTRKEKENFTTQDIKNRAEKVINNAIKSGTLVMRTNCDVDWIVGLKGIEALLELKEKYKDLITLQVAAFAQEGVFSHPDNASLLEKAMDLGADLIAGHTITCGEGEKHIDFILNLAVKYNCPADFHLDESGNREHYLLPYLAKKVEQLDLFDRVNAIHMCTLSALDETELTQALDFIKNAKLKVSIAPTAISTRKIAPVKKLLEIGVPVGLGSDNIRDFFNPLGCGDVKQVALLLSYLQAFYSPKEVKAIFNMITSEGARVLDVEFAIKEGEKANITVFPVKTAHEVISNQVAPSVIIRNGCLVDR